MKEILQRLFTIAICLASLRGMGQSGDKTIPVFRIALTDSSYFENADLKKKHPLLLVYFSPGCEHCGEFVRDMLRNYEDYRKVEVVLISNESLAAVRTFETTYELSKYKNIKTGTEGSTFKIQRYYQINRFPFVAVFDKAGKEIAIFREETRSQKIIPALTAASQ